MDYSASDFGIQMTSGSKQSLYLAGAPCLCWSEPWELAGAAPEPDPKLSSSGAAAERSVLSHGALEFPLLTPRRTARHMGRTVFAQHDSRDHGASSAQRGTCETEIWTARGTVTDTSHYRDTSNICVSRHSIRFYSCALTHLVKRDVVFYLPLQFCPPALSQAFGAFPRCYKVPLRPPSL